MTMSFIKNQEGHSLCIESSINSERILEIIQFTKRITVAKVYNTFKNNVGSHLIIIGQFIQNCSIKGKNNTTHVSMQKNIIIRYLLFSSDPM